MEKITYLAFQSFDEKVYNYELIGTGMILSFFPKSQRIIVTGFESGIVYKDEILDEKTKIKNFPMFVAFAQFYYLDAINTLNEFSNPLSLLFEN